MRKILISILLFCISCMSCTVYQVSYEYANFSPEDDTPQLFKCPIKVFLDDGSVVIFKDGAEISNAKLFGQGKRYGVKYSNYEEVTEIETKRIKQIIKLPKSVQGMPSFMVLSSIIYFLWLIIARPTLQF